MRGRYCRRRPLQSSSWRPHRAYRSRPERSTSSIDRRACLHRCVSRPASAHRSRIANCARELSPDRRHARVYSAACRHRVSSSRHSPHTIAKIGTHDCGNRSKAGGINRPGRRWRVEGGGRLVYLRAMAAARRKSRAESDRNHTGGA